MRVICYAPAHHHDHWVEVLTAAAAQNGCEVIGVATGDWYETLAEARRLGVRVLVARREHIPPGGIPGVKVLGEVAGEEGPDEPYPSEPDG